MQPPRPLQVNPKVDTGSARGACYGASMRTLRPFARLVVGAVAGLSLSACERASKPSAPEPPPAPKVEAPATLPLPDPTVDRAGLLQALAAAGSAYAAGRADDGPALAGRRFVIRQAFGCAGPAPRDGPPQPGVAVWSWGAKNQTIELSLQPADWKDWGPSDPAAAAWEAVEGFWLTRPWLLTEDCPAAPAAGVMPGPIEPMPAVSRPTAGLAAVFERGGSRVGRRDGKAFTYTVRSDDGPLAAPTSGYRIVLEGRFTAFPEGRAIKCRAANPDERPTCIAAATIDRIAFETADGRPVTEWRIG